MKDSLVTLLSKKYRYHTVALLLGALYCCIMLMSQDYAQGDIKWFSEHNQRGLFFGIDRWHTWSSRLLVESLTAVFANHIMIWGAITVIAGSILFWSIGRLLWHNTIWQSCVLFGVFLLVNVNIFASAGVYATTINYLWPAAAFAFSVASLVRPFTDTKIRKTQSIVAVPMFIFASMSEQLAVLGVLLGAVYVGSALLKRKKVSSLALIFMIIAVMGVINVVVCPGNAHRLINETNTWWPGFDHLSLTRKIMNGFLIVSSRLFLAPEPLVGLFMITLAYLSYRRKNIRAFAALVPGLMLSILFFFLVSSNFPVATNINYYNLLRTDALTATPIDMPDRRIALVCTTLFLIIGAGIVASIVFLYGKTKKTLLLITLMASGLMVTGAATLSPTLFASGTRTEYYLLVILTFIEGVLINDITKNYIHKKIHTNSTAGPLKASPKLTV